MTFVESEPLGRMQMAMQGKIPFHILARGFASVLRFIHRSSEKINVNILQVLEFG